MEKKVVDADSIGYFQYNSATFKREFQGESEQSAIFLINLQFTFY